MQIDVFCEEPSAEAALRNVLPRIVAGRASHKIISFQGKQQMLRRLVHRLRGYAHRIHHENLCVVVLIDNDADDCKELKRRLDDTAVAAGLTTKSAAPPGARFHVVNRVIIEELEAWFFGDVEALRQAYPKVPESLSKKEKYRDPDAITGGTWEALFGELKRVSYYGEYFPKIEVARNVAQHMEPNRNTSRSFQVFRQAIDSLCP